MTAAQAEPGVADQLAKRIDGRLRDHLWNGPPIVLGQVPHVPLDLEETCEAGGGEFDVVLADPAGGLYDVNLTVTVTARPR